MRRLAGILVALFAAWLGLAAPVHAAPVPTASVQNYTYDSHHHRALVVDAASERGSPATANLAITTSTVDRWSRGTLAGSSESKSLAATTYDATQRLAHVVGSTGTTAESVQTIEGDPSSLQRSRVAAKTADELASGMGRTGSALTKSDPFHRSVSWVVDNPAAERFAIRGGDGVGRELYQLPGEVNGKSGVFEWIIDRSGSNPFINHQRFIPGGSITGVPNQVVP